MAKNLIRWNRSDYARLRSAVSSFNKQVNKLEKLEDKTEYLPDIKDYQTLKRKISSRTELNRVIKSLKKFSEPREQQIVEFGSGNLMTKWESKELKLSERRATKSLILEKFKLETRPGIMYGMGEERVKEIEDTLESFKNLATSTGTAFERVKERVFNIGISDRELYKAKIFRENYFEALDNLKHLDNYDLLKAELEKIKNPINFYDAIKDNDMLMDIFNWYMGSDGEIKVYGGFKTSQDAFNKAIEMQGINISG